MPSLPISGLLVLHTPTVNHHYTPAQKKKGAKPAVEFGRPLKNTRHNHTTWYMLVYRLFDEQILR